MEPAVTLRDVSFAFGDRQIFTGANLTVAAGEFATIVGPNGGGKTTLLKLLLGLLRPDRGEVKILGRAPEQGRSRVGYLPQHARHDPQFPATVMDVVLMGRLGNRWIGPHSQEDRALAREALGEVGLPDLAERSFAELSGGQQQRTLIARALCSQPDLLLFDEPTANVDSQAEEQFFALMKDLNQRMTILTVSHDLGLVSQVASQVICVNHNIIVHAASELTGDHLQEIYAAEMSIVHHNQVLEHPHD